MRNSNGSGEIPLKSGKKLKTGMCTVAVVDDHDLVRAGIEAILTGSGWCAVCGSGKKEREAIQLVETHQPDVLILDLFLGYRDGISFVKDLVARHPETKILALSEYPDFSHAERAMKAGARGFLTKNSSAEHLLAAVQSIHRGHPYLTRHCAALMAGKPVPRAKAPRGSLDRLTDREFHVFQLVGVGLGTGEIAKQLGLSRKTIEYYNDNIKHKVGYATAAHLKQKATEWMAAVESPERGEVARTAETGDSPRFPDSDA